jgi:hypothetical protein
MDKTQIPSTKHQIPNKLQAPSTIRQLADQTNYKLQAPNLSSKFQITSTKFQTNSKHQAPSASWRTKHQIPEKFQAPSTKFQSDSKHQAPNYKLF